MQRTVRLFSFLILLSVLSSCGSSAPVLTPDPSSTIPPFSLPTETPALPTEQPTTTPIPAPERAKYSLDTALDYAGKTVSVDQVILYPNHSAETLSDLVLAVVPNLWPGGFTLTALSVDGTPVSTYNLAGQKLEFALPAPLAPGNTLTVSLQYTLVLPFAEQQDPSLERPRIYGYTARQVNLANWYPFIVPYEAGTGWVLHDPWFFGEHLVYEAADYEVNLRTDPGVVVAASGFPESDGEATRYTLTAGRAFAISASPEFQVASAQLGDVTISSYYFPFYESPGQAVLQVSAQAVELYSQRFGA
jgi:hypothetical protein